MITKPKVRLLTYTPLPEKVVSMGAKLCYSSSDIEDLENDLSEEEISKFIIMLSTLGHESPIEHISFTFGIENVSRVLLAQLTRHRLSSYSVKSQRYVKEDLFEYIEPEAIRGNDELVEIFRNAMVDAQIAYDDLVEGILNYEIEKNHTYAEIMKIGRRELGLKYEKYAIENARYVLPNACETKIVMTMNARSLINFFKLRTCRRSQTEIRELSEEMYFEVMKVAPNIFRNKVAGCISDKKCPEGKMTCGEPRYDLSKS